LIVPRAPSRAFGFDLAGFESTVFGTRFSGLSMASEADFVGPVSIAPAGRPAVVEEAGERGVFAGRWVGAAGRVETAA
jgi:hypothetical protein